MVWERTPIRRGKGSSLKMSFSSRVASPFPSSPAEDAPDLGVVGIAVDNHQEAGSSQPAGGGLEAVNEGAGGIDDVDLPRPNLFLYLGGDAVGADCHRLALDIANILGYPDADARQPLQHLLVMHHRPQRLHPTPLAADLFQDIDGALDAEAKANLFGLFNLHFLPPSP